MSHMFCFQCEQTIGCTGCTGKAGACGKTAETAALQDRLTGALIGLAHACQGNEELITAGTHSLIREGLFTAVTNVNFDDSRITGLIDRIHDEKRRIAPECSACMHACGRNDDYDMNLLWTANEDIGTSWC